MKRNAAVIKTSHDFRYDVLKSLYRVKPQWDNLTPLIHACMEEEGKLCQYYSNILRLMQQKGFIVLDANEFSRFEQLFNGAFADFPLRAMLMPDGIDEYRRVRKEKNGGKA